MSQEKKQEIEDLILEIEELEETMGSAEQVFDALDEELKEVFAPQLLLLLSEFKKLCLKTKEVFEGYFKYEKENNLAVNFRYRKIYKELKRYFDMEANENK